MLTSERKIGVEVEFAAPMIKVQQAIHSYYSGHVHIQTRQVRLSSDYITIALDYTTVDGYKFTLKPETNALTVKADARNDCGYCEIAFEPTSIAKAIALEDLLRYMSQSIEHTEDDAVSIQLNVDAQDLSPDSVLQIAFSEPLVSYSDVRKPYLGLPPLDLLTLDNSTREKLAENYLVGMINMLTGNDFDNRENAIRIYGNPRHLHDPQSPVPYLLKLTRHRISSLLLTWMQPDDPVRQAIEDLDYIWTIPVIEYREFPSNFMIAGKLGLTLGHIGNFK